MTPGEIVASVDASTSAAAAAPASPPAARRLPAQGPKPTYLCVNADESEPAPSRTARSCCETRTLLIEGCLIDELRDRRHPAFIYIRGEYRDRFEMLRRRSSRPASAG